MKIGYILPNYCLVNGSSGGVTVQAMDWMRLMKRCGHEVICVNVWNDYDWKSFDIIHFFYFGFSFESLYRFLKIRATKARFICSPILDPHGSVLTYKILSYCSVSSLKIWNEFSLLRKYAKLFDLFLTRSEFEGMYLKRAFGIDAKKIKIVPLSSRFVLQNMDVPNKKDYFCLHVSRISDKTKNVERLVNAAIKYNFPLVIAGACTDEFLCHLKCLIKDADNIQILGRVSDEKLKELYSKARVFALPSIREGVGLVALEAASYGCDIVITNIGGPKEYFLPNAIAVNPYSVDDIGMAVKKFLDGDTFQPALQKMIAEKYSEEKVTEKLLNIYTKIGAMH